MRSKTLQFEDETLLERTLENRREELGEPAKLLTDNDMMTQFDVDILRREASRLKDLLQTTPSVPMRVSRVGPQGWFGFAVANELIRQGRARVSRRYARGDDVVLVLVGELSKLPGKIDDAEECDALLHFDGHTTLQSLTDETKAEEYNTLWEPDQAADVGAPWPDENRFEDVDSRLVQGYVNMNQGAGIIFFDGDYVLLGLRTDNNTWCAPGGKVDPGETLQETAIRETFEEFGIQLRLEDLGEHQILRRDDGFEFCTFFCKGARDWEVVLDPEEHSEWGWFRLGELPHPLHPGVGFLIGGAHDID